MKRLFLIFAVLFSILAFSCTKNNGELKMQNFSPEDLSPRIQWALVSDPYVACRKEASYEAETVASFRKGEIYEIKGNASVKTDDITETWYALGIGWVPSSALKIFSNKLKAETAKSEMMK